MPQQTNIMQPVKTSSRPAPHQEDLDEESLQKYANPKDRSKTPDEEVMLCGFILLILLFEVILFLVMTTLCTLSMEDIL